ncbi:HBL312Cp [Eremothecium sinecaudum]|uniref:Tubulin-specific chaperone A n=1 Tax=Eremothecium sinecaudum TaxID=45286 RepID=A0A109UW26_9SACH|nr:HBL312Cp [Eremothecium sinecaudum]AMD18590.1 HBL312Cp [Eremothecium sinecaudum]
MAPTQLEIKVRALQRLVKEEKYYINELEEQKAHIERLKQDPQIDQYDLKKQVEVMEDTKRLLPKFYEKVEQFFADLSNFVKEYQGEEDLTEAKKALESAKVVLDKNKSA